MEALSIEVIFKLKSISCRGTTEHKAPKVRMNLVCFRKRLKYTDESGEGDEVGKR